jgi:hypothetical protein
MDGQFEGANRGFEVYKVGKMMVGERKYIVSVGETVG